MIMYLFLFFLFTGFVRNRISDRLRIIRNLPNLLEQMKLQVEENSELESQLCVLQQLLEVSKEENSALEVVFFNLNHPINTLFKNN